MDIKDKTIEQIEAECRAQITSAEDKIATAEAKLIEYEEMLENPGLTTKARKAIQGMMNMYQAMVAEGEKELNEAQTILDSLGGLVSKKRSPRRISGFWADKIVSYLKEQKGQYSTVVAAYRYFSAKGDIEKCADVDFDRKAYNIVHGSFYYAMESGIIKRIARGKYGLP